MVVDLEGGYFGAIDDNLAHLFRESVVDALMESGKATLHAVAAAPYSCGHALSERRALYLEILILGHDFRF